MLEAYPGPRFTSAIDAETKVPPELSASYRSSRVRGKVTVRAARVSDAASVVSLLVDSITKLCVDDHRGDPATLERWLQNKTVAHFQHWLADGSSFIVVAELGSKLCGVALLNRETVQLCYVLPGLQGIGVGRALMHALESEALRRGVRRVSLMSSGSARRFYERLGYVAGGEGGVAFGVLRQYPYTKAL
ncbi:MAG: GNAT family N-acetyltransferase [Myxococcota bacterium]